MQCDNCEYLVDGDPYRCPNCGAKLSAQYGRWPNDRGSWVTAVIVVVVCTGIGAIAGSTLGAFYRCVDQLVRVAADPGRPNYLWIGAAIGAFVGILLAFLIRVLR